MNSNMFKVGIKDTEIKNDIIREVFVSILKGYQDNEITPFEEIYVYGTTSIIADAIDNISPENKFYGYEEFSEVFKNEQVCLEIFKNMQITVLTEFLESEGNRQLLNSLGVSLKTFFIRLGTAYNFNELDHSYFTELKMLRKELNDDNASLYGHKVYKDVCRRLGNVENLDEFKSYSYFMKVSNAYIVFMKSLKVWYETLQT